MAFTKTEFHGWRYCPKVDAYIKIIAYMAKTIFVCPDKNGVVRNVQLLVGSCNGMKTVLDRPIHKIVLLAEAEEGSIPQRGDQHKSR